MSPRHLGSPVCEMSRRWRQDFAAAGPSGAADVPERLPFASAIPVCYTVHLDERGALPRFEAW